MPSIIQCAGYITHHSLTFPSSQTLQSRVDAYMAHFSHLEDLRARAQARMRNYVDEDGFTMVVRGGRNAPAKQDQAQAALERKQKEQEEKRKANTGFYRFQAREGKKEHVRRLLEKFEQDKKRVKERKERRKFKVSFSSTCLLTLGLSYSWDSHFKLKYSV